MEERLSEIRINDLIWQPDKSKVPVLNQVSINLSENNFYGIIGPNGAGKTSLVRELLGFIWGANGTDYLED